MRRHSLALPKVAVRSYGYSRILDTYGASALKCVRCICQPARAYSLSCWSPTAGAAGDHHQAAGVPWQSRPDRD
eukprot:8331990-Pyramimonas_sp.AAC.2